MMKIHLIHTTQFVNIHLCSTNKNIEFEILSKIVVSRLERR